MKCPTCKEINLVMSERQGIEIDYCPECRGVWLDRGELDKIIAKSISTPVDTAPEPRREPVVNYEDRRDSDPKYRDEYGRKPYKRRKSFFEELFD